MTWTQHPPIATDKIHRGCACCSSAAQFAHNDMLIAVGFGAAYATKGDLIVYDEQDEDDEPHTVADIEKLAAQDPDHDWRIVLAGPLHGETYQRHLTGPHAGKWVCIQSDQGFA